MTVTDAMERMSGVSVASCRRVIEFTVIGRPQQRGSKTASVVTKAGGEIVRRPNGSPAIRVMDSNKKSGDWMTSVKQVAAGIMGDRELIRSPVVLTVQFYFARPKAHYRTGRNAGKLKDSAPSIHAQSPDLAKLIRCLEDALTGVVWADDRQVWKYGEGTARHWTSQQERAVVRVEYYVERDLR